MIGQIHADGLRKLVEDGEIRGRRRRRPLRAGPGRRRAATAPSTRLHADAAGGHRRPRGRGGDDHHAHDDAPRARPRGRRRGQAAVLREAAGADLRRRARACATPSRVGLTAQVGFHSRFHPLHQRARAGSSRGRARRGRWATRCATTSTGRPATSCPGTARGGRERADAGGGALLEHSIHSADILTWLFGPPTRVSRRDAATCSATTSRTSRRCTIEHASGVVGTLLTIFNGVRGPRGTTARGVLRAGRGRGHDRLPRRCAPRTASSSSARTGPRNASTSPRCRDPPLQRRSGSPTTTLSSIPTSRIGRGSTPSGTGRRRRRGSPDAVTAHAVVDAAYRSADRGAPVDGPDH